VNLYGRFKTARANLIVSRSATGWFEAGTGWLVGAPQTAHWGSPAPTIAPQLRHIVGRPGLVWFDSRSDNTDLCVSVSLWFTGVWTTETQRHRG